jgi:large subunit ribosomal protein L17
MLRNLVTSLFEHERVKTTEAKAKELRPLAEKMIGLGKRGDLHARRQALSVVRKGEVVRKIFDTISPRYQGRNGGYLRLIKVGVRPGDGAPMSIVELVKEGKELKGTTPKQRREKRLKKSKEAQTAQSPASGTSPGEK